MKSIYGLICPISKQVNYIGLSVNPEKRFEQHMSDTADTAKTRWIRALRELNLSPILFILSVVDDEIALAEEERWIGFGLGSGWPLKNEALPGPSKFAFALPELASLPGIDYVSRYAVPGHIAFGGLPRWIRWLGGNRQYHKTTHEVWFRTTDGGAFPIFYPYMKDYECYHVYGPAVVLASWVNLSPEQAEPSVSRWTFPQRIGLRSENSGSHYSESHPMFIDDKNPFVD